MIKNQMRAAILLLFCTSAVWAQEAENIMGPPVPTVEKTWWQRAFGTSGTSNHFNDLGVQTPMADVVENVDENPYHLKASYDRRSIYYSFNTTGTDGNSSSFNINPNAHDWITTSFTDSRHLGVAISLPTGSSEYSTATYGQTTGKDLRLEAPFYNWMVSAHYATYTGFYGQSGSSSSAPDILMPGLTSSSFSLRGTYVMDPKKYSIQSVVDQTARQVGTGGSAFYSLNLDRQILNNSQGALFSDASQSNFALDPNLGALDILALTAMVGYGAQYNFNPKFFAGGAIAVGGGPAQVTQTMLTTGSKKGTQLDVSAGIDLNIGFNGKYDFYGFRTNVHTDTVNVDSVGFTADILQASLYYGRRF